MLNHANYHFRESSPGSSGQCSCESWERKGTRTAICSKAENPWVTQLLEPFQWSIWKRKFTQLTCVAHDDEISWCIVYLKNVYKVRRGCQNMVVLHVFATCSAKLFAFKWILLFFVSWRVVLEPNNDYYVFIKGTNMSDDTVLNVPSQTTVCISQCLSTTICISRKRKGISGMLTL